MTPKVDLVLVFRSSTGNSQVQPKALARKNARQASEQYAKLLQVLKQGGLQAVGKRGERDGQLLVLVSCPSVLLKRLAQRERHSDFLYGLPTNNAVTAEDLDSAPLSPADQIRLVYTYITSTESDGGLGIAPGSPQWNRVESVVALHDHLFNDTWIKAWTTRQLGLVSSERVKSQFGEAVALYFTFLASYTKFLIFISAVGVGFYFFGIPYSSVYSSILLVWSITFVEWWRIKQRVLAVRWGTRGSFRVEKRRAQYQPISWWRRELRMLASVPVILLFGAVLVSLLTGIFVFEAFVTQLYKGPGVKFLSFSPTILFMTLVPRLLSIYHTYAVKFTDWENHSRQSTHDGSLTIKTFSLSAIVAYGGLALSAFVYVPFGEEVMTFVQSRLFHNGPSTGSSWTSSVLSSIVSSPTATAVKNATGFDFNSTTMGDHRQFWETDHGNARSKLDPSRLQNQMFAITVTNQVVNTFLEIGLPYITRAIASFRSGKGLSRAKNSVGAKAVGPQEHEQQGQTTNGTKEKRVAFEDDKTSADLVKNANGKEEKEFLEKVRREVALPEYTLFEDYSEMVTQFGYVALWSTIWPLAPVMSLVNNWFELRSDAFKIAVHTRRPIPARTDTIGPWLDSLTFITWLAALTNSALVYLFRPSDQCKAVGTTLQHNHHRLNSESSSTRQLLLSAAVIALAASHGYIIVRGVIKHVLERIIWKGSKEEKEEERLETAVKQEYLKSIGVADVAREDLADSKVFRENGEMTEGQAFWEHDEGFQELSKGVKDS
ncbi:DUF590-domain-containing protein [Irpex rosettiformis]|uniref:DUF590-domain-containing protein n=1 Tax=Irpex rosettiformis TaxID=378272 RepID=A0ACB8TUR9_9APHY|nr:DUF590-domain-containing protein [Irpex rosettiformis]